MALPGALALRARAVPSGFQTGQPTGVEDKYTSFLFWAVILLAGAGLSVGGYVLVRLLTREIRLAQPAFKPDFTQLLTN